MMVEAEYSTVVPMMVHAGEHIVMLVQPFCIMISQQQATPTLQFFALQRTASNVSNLSGTSDNATEGLGPDDSSEFSSFMGDDVRYTSIVFSLTKMAI